MRCESAIGQDVDAIVILGTIAAPQRLENSLVKTLHHESGVTQVIRCEGLLRVDGAGLRRKDNKSALIGGKIHTVETSSHEKVPNGSGLELLDLVAKT